MTGQGCLIMGSSSTLNNLFLMFSFFAGQCRLPTRLSRGVVASCLLSFLFLSRKINSFRGAQCTVCCVEQPPQLQLVWRQSCIHPFISIWWQGLLVYFGFPGFAMKLVFTYVAYCFQYVLQNITISFLFILFLFFFWPAV